MPGVVQCTLHASTAPLANASLLVRTNNLLACSASWALNPRAARTRAYTSRTLVTRLIPSVDPASRYAPGQRTNLSSSVRCQSSTPPLGISRRFLWHTSDRIFSRGAVSDSRGGGEAETVSDADTSPLFPCLLLLYAFTSWRLWSSSPER